MKPLVALAALWSAAALADGALTFGHAVDSRKATRAIRLEMTDQMRFNPAEITVKRGEALRFEAANKGTVVHELVIDTLDGLKQHAEKMKSHGMAHAGMSHAEPNEVQVEPGKTGLLGWRFTKAGVYYYGCMVPGHFEAGMVGKLIVR